MGSGQMEIEWNTIKSLKSDSEFTLELEGGDRVSGKVSYTQKEGMRVVSSVNKANINLVHLKQASPLHTNLPGEIMVAQSNAPSSSDKSETLHTERKLTPIGQNEEATFGEEQESPPLTFLRGSSVQLAPGQIEGRLIFSYMPLHTESVFGDNQIRLFNTSLSINTGLHDRVEGFINVPFSHVRARRGSVFSDSRDQYTGLGDISFGVTTLLKPESVNLPEIGLNISVSAPTGDSPYDGNMAYVGSGHWEANAGLNFIRSVEPAILFGGFGVGYIFGKTENGHKYEYGWTGDYHLGLGFAINDRLSLSSVFRGGYRPPLKTDGETYSFSLDPLSLTFGMGYRINYNTVFEPSVRFGLNDDGGDAAFALGISRKFN